MKTSKRSSSSRNISDVVGGRRTERVAPHRVRTHGGVGAHVEDGPSVVGPAQAVVDVGNDVVEVAAGGEVAEAQLVALAAGGVDRVRRGGVVRVDLEVADLEEAVTGRELVQVEDDLLSPAAVTTVASPPAVDRVLPALVGAVVVLVRTVGTGAEVSVCCTRDAISS